MRIKANNKERVETGALQINDDWTGLFIRGDDCSELRDVFERYLYLLDGSEHDVFSTKLRKIIQIIDKDVFGN